MASVYSKAESSTQRLGWIMTALSWPTFLRWCKHLQEIVKTAELLPSGGIDIG